MATNLTIRLDPAAKRSLDQLAKATGRTRAFLAQDALQHYLAEQAWQVGEIHKALGEADAGDFAADVDVKSARAKWKVNAR